MVETNQNSALNRLENIHFKRKLKKKKNVCMLFVFSYVSENMGSFKYDLMG